MIPGPRRRPTYGMAYGLLSGVQSSPRIMRGAPVQRPVHHDVALTDARRKEQILKNQGRLYTDPADVHPMSGLESQGLARTMSGVPGESLAYARAGYDPARRDVLKRTGMNLQYGSLSGSTLGADTIEMPEECMRPGEVLISPGVCGPPGSVKPVTTSSTSPYVPAAAATVKPAAKSKLSPQLLVLGAVAVGAILYFGRK